MPRLKIDKETLKKIELDLYRFACEGLRTLVFSRKEITENVYQEFLRNFNSKI